MLRTKEIQPGCFLVTDNENYWLTQEPRVDPALGCYSIQVTEKSWKQRKGVWITSNGELRLISLPEQAIKSLQFKCGSTLFRGFEQAEDERDFDNQVAFIFSHSFKDLF